MNIRSKIMGSLLGAALLLSASSVAAQTAANLQFVYNGESGTVFIVNTLNAKPANRTRCTLRIGLGIHYEGDTTATATELTKVLRFTGSRNRGRVARALVEGLGSVALKGNKRPILSIQTTTTCAGGTPIVSNAVARYVQCGLAQDLTPQRYLNLLENRIRRAVRFTNGPRS